MQETYNGDERASCVMCVKRLNLKGLGRLNSNGLGPVLSVALRPSPQPENSRRNLEAFLYRVAGFMSVSWFPGNLTTELREFAALNGGG